MRSGMYVACAITLFTLNALKPAGLPILSNFTTCTPVKIYFQVIPNYLAATMIYMHVLLQSGNEEAGPLDDLGV